MYKIKFHETSKWLWPVYTDVCCEVNIFFVAWCFHGSVLHKMKIDPLYFWDIYDVNLWEKNLAEVRLIYAEQISLYNVIILGKKRDSSTDVFLWNYWNFQEQWWLLLKTTFCYIIKKYVEHKSAIFNTILLLYCMKHQNRDIDFRFSQIPIWWHQLKNLQKTLFS